MIKNKCVTEREVSALMDLLRSEPAPFHWFIFIRLAIATGMRRGNY